MPIKITIGECITNELHCSHIVHLDGRIQNRGLPMSAIDIIELCYFRDIPIPCHLYEISETAEYDEDLYYEFCK